MITGPVRVIAAFLVLATSALAAEAANSSQTVIPNAAGDAAIDPAKVNRYKSLLGTFNADDKFNEAFKWTDILDEYRPLNADCSAQCLTCAPGCNPSCCARGSPPTTETGSDSDNPVSTDRVISRPRIPWPPGLPPRGRPLPPLSCPCHCEADCPRNVQTVCCFTPGSRSDRPPTNSLRTQQAPLGGIENDAQNSLLDQIQPFNSPRNRNWGPPHIPLACPCFCEPTCPPYIQTVCCTTPGSGRGGDRRGQQQYEIVKAPKTHDTLAMITESARAGPVSVLAAVNLTVFDSFVTFNLVQCLGRTDEIIYNADAKTFEIILTTVVGPEGKETALAQTFVVIDGSRLLEEEQILLGSGFLSRAGSVKIDQEFLTPLQDGLPVLTGIQAAEE
ncbi:hypothetical protein PV04_01949 [Phialophora macrospora]|uniref:Uncharacterized protein n=1 Tax=Phialophora macrospora TaxID=1851006 RepID=A0A0D2GN92_9EURO|nr:hypothetical protein PV04_01949 [Phialophora macrospora]